MYKIKPNNFVAIFLIFFVTITTKIYLDIRKQETKIHEAMERVFYTLDMIGKSTYFVQSLVYSSTGSAQKFLQDHVDNDATKLLSGVFVISKSHEISSYAVAENRGLSYSVIRSIFDATAVVNHKFTITKTHLIVLSQIPLHTQFVGAIIDKQTLVEMFHLSAVKHSESGTLKFNFIIKYIVKDNWEVYFLISLLFIILVVAFYSQARAIRKGIYIHNKLIRHDLTDVVGISSTANFIVSKEMKNLAIDTNKVNRLLQYSGAHLRFALRLVNQIGDAGQTIKPKLFPTDINEVILNFAEDSKIIYEDSLELDYSCNHTSLAITNTEQLLGVFINLLKNAKRHGEGKSVWIETEEEQHGIRIHFINKGYIPESIKNNIFKPFVKNEDSEGAGLGLYHCKNIMEAHGGDIAIKTEKFRVIASLFLQKENGNKVGLS